MQQYMILAVIIRFVVDFLLLFAVKQLFSPFSGFLRPLIGAFVGGVYAVGCIVPGLSGLQGNLWYGVSILLCCLVAFGSLMAYYIGLQQSLDVARTMTFATVVFSQMTLILSIRSGNHFFTKGLFANRWLWGAIAVVISLMLIVMLIPALQTLFGVGLFTSVQWWCIIGLSFVPMVVVEVVKFVQRLIKK